ncbi:acyl-CoA N-acyltransferase [Pyronema domesticum]|uniref:Similar to N-alpha-acetyltransferase 20 acc. no. Q6P632 n=1 Tax=Pyronema omphalodes (strain CBS 100304) TaxID=1076935 RepID=U4LNZ3_PYROM|nr:acyl-CoA N-acyltransferase [Pyronema domesticum]CCX33861.1 Similar to N-alpha-acetyltransferase 20; acc. no. Q6P632 [Pyronema omphalodes CBS 100304]
MSSLRPFTALDLFKFNATNLDPLTENYDISFYMSYLARWPTYFCAMESAGGRIMGYIMGKAEGAYENWHGHVTAVTVAPSYRRLGLAKTMMDELERITDDTYKGYFVDLYVRVSNELAIGMYERLGYSVYRTVIDYYSGSRPGDPDEDAYDMRKPSKRDKKRESIRENGRSFRVYPEECY